MVRRKSFIL